MGPHTAVLRNLGACIAFTALIAAAVHFVDPPTATLRFVQAKK
jgi:hypothetical protein